MDDGAAPHRFTNPEDYFRSQYFEVINLVSGEITHRFALALPRSIENLLLEASSSSETNCNIPDIISLKHTQRI